MPIVPIDQVEEGQALAQGARVGSGAILAPPGTTLTAELIARLKALGITELDIRQSVAGPSAAEQLEALERRFVDHDEDELMIELKAHVRAHITSTSDLPDMGGATGTQTLSEEEGPK